MKQIKIDIIRPWVMQIMNDLDKKWDWEKRKEILIEPIFLEIKKDGSLEHIFDWDGRVDDMLIITNYWQRYLKENYNITWNGFIKRLKTISIVEYRFNNK